MSKKKSPRTVPALKVRQWLAEWDEISWDADDRRSKPQPWFYQFSMNADELKALSGIYARTTKRSRGADDLGIQRGRDSERCEEIGRFVRYGYPWSDLSKAKQRSGEFKDLRQPGWLPTAIVVNILTANDVRLGSRVSKNDAVVVKDRDDGSAEVRLPNAFTGKSWRHSSLSPIEVIDGQHRLWSFEDTDLNGDFELPVVAFVGLDLSWQAYLFYTINIKPKKINASLAFDLYPLLRTQEWLTKFEGHAIYRETRAQEVVDLLWAHPQSPWHHRINMLGEKGTKGIMVTQAAWVRSLLASFIKSWEGRGVRIGGLYGTAVGKHETVLPWSRPEQAAFLIVAGLCLRSAIESIDDEWAVNLREQETSGLFDQKDDLAFIGPNNLLNQDQGVRILLQVLNDVFYVCADAVDLNQWGGRRDEGEVDEEQIDIAIKTLKKNKKIMSLLEESSECLATYDWRASSGPGLTEMQRMQKAAFRGSGGYRDLRQDVLKHLAEYEGSVGDAANVILNALGY